MENNSTFVNKEQNFNYPYSIYSQCLPSKNDISEINERKYKIGKENETTSIAFHCVNKEQVIECIRRYPDCFMWEPSDVTGVDPSVVVHKIPTYPEAKPVKQEWSLKIKEEIAKQLDNGFIEPITYTTMEMGLELYSKLLVENTSLSTLSWSSNVPTMKPSMKLASTG